MQEFTGEAIANYQKCNNGTLPELIIIYRDGIGGPTLQEKCYNFEIPQVRKVIEDY